MKYHALLMSLVLLTGSLVVEISAQTRKSTKKKPAAQTVPSDPTKTRARRTTTSTPDPAPTASPVETPAEQKTEPASNTVPATATVEPEPKQEAKPEPKPAPTPVDSLTTLRDQIAAAEVGPERIRLQLKLVEELVAAGNKSDALKELHTITNTDVFDPQGFYNTGNSFARLNDTDGAVEAYRKAIEQRKNRYSRAYNNLGVVFLRVGRWDEAYEALSIALKLENFRYPEASYNLGRLYAARGQNDLAVREWKRVLAMNPEHTAAKDALSKVGSYDRVAVKSAGTTSPKLGQDRTQEPPTTESINPSAAEKPVAVKSSSFPRTTTPLELDQLSYDVLQRARTLTEKGNTLGAIDNYKRVLKREGGYFAPANLELSFAFLSLKRIDEALENLLLVTNRDGGRYPISYFHLARVYEMKGDLKQAEEAFSKVAEAFGSQNNQFLLDLSRVREKQGNFSGALEAMEQYVKLMKQQGQEPSWSDERLTALRAKQSTAPKE